ncbi:LLM class flavin-dependent oxidoreductase [Kribbella sp. NPDC051770]|uniref:LLM class flavin-dependent oxidoreductase n=1 Tax=Kribbella sp. NPDC051770 TaxID=3155413 RepID=UPI003449FA8F
MGVLFGVAVEPSVDVTRVRAVAATAEDAGLDLIGVQDHPYVAEYLDAFVVIGDLIAHTERIGFFPDVANLPLRPAAQLARVASSLSLASGGRFQLGLGAGGYWDAITSMGVERKTPAEALAAQEEAIALLRALWRPGKVTASGDWYGVRGLAGQEPAPGGVEIWLGSQGKRSLALTGKVADGWAAPIPAYLPYEKWAEGNQIVDRAAVEAGRDPKAIRRFAQVVGTVTGDGARGVKVHGDAPVRGGVQDWVDVLSRFAEDGFDGFVLWPEGDAREQARRFGEEVAPKVRERLG